MDPVIPMASGRGGGAGEKTSGPVLQSGEGAQGCHVLAV